MEEKAKLPVDHLNKIYNDLVEPRELEQSPADFFLGLSPRDASLCRIMTWYYKVFEGGYQLIFGMGFDTPEKIAMLQYDLSRFSQSYDWKEIQDASSKIQEIFEHYSSEPKEADKPKESEKPRDENSDEYKEWAKKYDEWHDAMDAWIDKMNDLNDECTDMFMDGDALFYERLYDFYQKEETKNA